MGLLWCDGFDHYGPSGADNGVMLSGAYANVKSARVDIDTAQVATGTHSVKFSGHDAGQDDYGIRKVLPAAKDKVGVAFRVYIPQFPSTSTGITLCDFVGVSSSRSQVGCFLGSNGEIRFRRGYGYFFNADTGTEIAATDPILVTGAWNHVEIQIYCHDTLGWIRVAINGVHRYLGTNLDTNYSGGTINSIRHGWSWAGGFAGSDNDTWWMDDLYIYDFTGSSGTDTDFCPTVGGDGIATNYIGELQVMYLNANGNTAENDWVPSTGTDAQEMVNEAATGPNDADYIKSTVAGDLTELDLSDLPEEITYIRGVQWLGRMSKIDSGAATIKFGAKSGANTTDAPERPITIAPTYWWDFINTDPQGGGRWTRTRLNAAKFRLTRVV